jgi:hypothetical protein
VAFAPNPDMGLTDLDIANGLDYEDDYDPDRPFDMEYEVIFDNVRPFDMEYEVRFDIVRPFDMEYEMRFDIIRPFDVENSILYFFTNLHARVRFGDIKIHLMGKNIEKAFSCMLHGTS